MKKLLCTLILILTTVGFVQAQTIEIRGLDVLILSGDVTPDIADDTQFPDTDIDGGFATHTFTIKNTGTALLSVGLSNLSNSTDFSQTTPPVPTDIATNETATFSVKFDPVDAVIPDKTSVVTVTIFNNDTFADEADYTFTVGGTATEVVPTSAPIIRVFGTPSHNVEIFDNTNASLANGTDYGDVFTVSNKTNPFRISNDGDDDLIIDNMLIPGSSSDFAIVESLSFPITIIPGGFFDFNVIYTPGGEFASSASVFIAHNDDTPSSLDPFSIKLLGNGILAVPEIDVQGLENSIVGDGTNVPAILDDTKFGQVDVDNGSQMHEFTILNTGDEDLILSGSPIVEISGSSDFTVTQQPILTTIGGPSGSTTFQITFDPSSSISNPIQAVVTILNNDSNESSYTFNIEGEGIPSVPEMDLLDNANQPLASGGSVDFGDTDISSGAVDFTFTIENTGTADLILEDVSPFVSIAGADAGDFTLSVIPASTITPSNNTTFIIRFNPSLPIGAKTATVSIDNNDSDENPYTFTLLGNGIDANNATPLLITQYYEGIGTNDKWIEVKNITSGVTTLPGAYNLALYEDSEGTSGFISTEPPTLFVQIPGLSPGEVVLFSRSGATLTNLGPVTVLPTEVCRFDGNDVILISPSIGSDCFTERIDIIGVVGTSSAVTWGENTSLIKGCGTDEAPALVYDPNQYIELTLTDVDNAVANTNIQLGIQTVGSTIWNGSWDNNIPDKTKDAIISGAYTNVGSFDVCNLTINGGATLTLDNGSTNYVSVEHNLTVAGTFTIGDTESLYVVDDGGVMSGAIDKKETTTLLNNFRDFTYWSSPVNTTVQQAFVSTGVDPNRIFVFNTQDQTWDVPIAANPMISAKGYISEAPVGTTQHNVTFSGTPNNGLISIPVVFINDADPDNDFNLIGNPYPSAIDIDKFILNVPDNSEIQNGAMNGTIWLWTHVTPISGSTAAGEFLGDDYATYNLSGGVGTGSGSGSGSAAPTKYIGSGQGFFTKVESGGTLWFTNEMREKDQNTQFFKTSDDKNKVTEEKDRIWLNIESNTGGAFNQLLIGFFDQATDGVDRGFDGSKVGAAWISFYSTIDNAKYAIQGLPSFTNDKKVPLGFDTYIDQPMTYKMSIDNIEGVLNDNDVYIVDNVLNITHDLKLADYEFDIDGKGNFPDRFTLQFTKSVLDIEDLELNNNFVVINEENSLRLKSTTVIAKLKVYDMMGRLLIDNTPYDSEFTINTHSIRKGTILILNVTFDNGAEVSKKAIKY